MKKNDIMKRTLAGMTAALTAASQLPAVFASADDFNSQPELAPTGQSQSEYPETLEGLYTEANEWYTQNGDILDGELASELEEALDSASEKITHPDDFDVGIINDAYTSLHNAYKAAKESMVAEPEPITYDEKVDAKDATCTEAGNLEYYIGSDGNYYTYSEEDGEDVYTPIEKDKVVISPLGHDWKLVEWHWFGNNEGASAFFMCSRDNETKTLATKPVITTIPATCEKDGKTIYTATVELDGQVYTDTKEEVIKATGHDWADPTYTWEKNTDGVYECKASRVCNNNSEEIETETAVATYEEITAATTKAKGKGRWTATFKSDAFEAQTNDVDIEMLMPEYGAPKYEWSKDYSTVTATRECLNGSDDEDIIETVKTKKYEHTAPTCTAKGKTRYVATFENHAFAEQEQIVEDVDPTGHTYGDPVFQWNEDNSECIAVFDCVRSDHTEYVECQLSTEYTTPPTCEKAGVAKVTATASFEGKTFTDTKEVPVAAKGHSWDITWFWKDNNTAVAYLKCTEDGTEKAIIANVEVKETPATCVEAGKIDYVATIEIDGKEYTDSKTVDTEIVPHDFVKQDDVWTATEDGGYTCTASRKCSVCGKIESETVTATYKVIKAPTVKAQGQGIYTAVFEDEEFKTATKLVDIEKLMPEYAEPVYTWSEDNSTVKAVRECLNGEADDAIVEEVTTTSKKTKDPSCTEMGETSFYADFENEAFVDQVKTIANIDKLPHTYGTPIWSWAPTAKGGYTATIKLVCKVCGEVETSEAEVTSEKKGDVTLYTAVAVVDGVEYASELTAKNDQIIAKNPVVTYEAGEGAVKLNWEAVEGAEKYAVLGYQSGKWVKLGEGYSNSYTINGLTAGKEYKVAVIAKFDGKWFEDLSNAITVTPKAAEVTTQYPTVTSVECNEQYHQVRITWTPVAKAEKYGIAAFVAGKWKILDQNITTTTYTSPKLTEVGRTYKTLVVAKVNGEWDLSKMNSRVFEVTIK